MLFLKDILAHYKSMLFSFLSCFTGLFLVLLVSIISNSMTFFINDQLDKMAINSQMLQIYDTKAIDRNWIERSVKDGIIEEISVYLKQEKQDFTLVGCNDLSNIFNLTFEVGNFFTTQQVNDNERVVVITADMKEYFNYPEINEEICIDGCYFKLIGIIEGDYENLFEDFNKVVFVPEGYMDNDCLSIYYYLGQEINWDNVLMQDNYLFIDQKMIKTSFKEIVNMISVILMILAYCTAIVALISSLNNSLTQLKLRKKEIGIKRALGCSKQLIYIQFLIEGIIVIVVAYLLTIIIAYLLLTIINISLQIHLSLSECVKSVRVILIIQLVFALIPAYKAMKISIINTMV